ncbi:MAG TPA: uL15m family ribosomal protein [Candidatus Pacearchaeota archaeon]|nr:uL15m family ribosomal protein [Candidatus Pacearchaeota archaeon]HPR80045.1 uL15m family ribosomal protein [Candidatus Pacearchaeota archaeon]
MQLHELKQNTTFKKKKRVGRGGKKGTYCGGGGKGQKGRAGAKFKPIIRGWIKRYPKLRGYNFNTQTEVSSVNLDVLEEIFESNTVINPEVLVAKRIIRKVDGKIPTIKILGTGEIKKSLTIEGCLVSKTTIEKIEKAGGKVVAKTVKEVAKKGVSKAKTKK